MDNNVLPNDTRPPQGAAPSPAAMPGVMALMKEAWALFTAHIWQLIAIGLIAGASAVALGALGGIIAGVLATDAAFVAGILAMALAALIVAVAVWSSIAMIRLLLQPATDRPIHAAFMSTRGLILAALWVGILQSLLVFGGTMLLLIGGVIVSVFTFFASYVLVDDGPRGMHALIRSRELVRGRWWITVGYMLAFGIMVWVAILLVSIVATMLGAPDEVIGPIGSLFAIVVGPLSLCYHMALYRNLKATRGATGPVPKPGQEKWYWILVALGPVIALILTVSLGSALMRAFDDGRLQEVIEQIQAEMERVDGPEDVAAPEEVADMDADMGMDADES